MKQKTVFTCQKCGYQSPKWLGKCPDCSAWNSMVEESSAPPPPGAGAIGGQNSQPIPICDVPEQSETRVATGIGELDRVLGGGIVPGSLILLGGAPGTGKSTILLQAMHNLAASVGNVLYVSGEESASQTRLRGERLRASHKQLLILAENSIEAILAHAITLTPQAMVVDSIQTVWTSSLESAPGSVVAVQGVGWQVNGSSQEKRYPNIPCGTRYQGWVYRWSTRLGTHG